MSTWPPAETTPPSLPFSSMWSCDSEGPMGCEQKGRAGLRPKAKCLFRRLAFFLPLQMQEGGRGSSGASTVLDVDGI